MVAEESGDVVKQDVEIVAGDAATAGGGAAGGSVETGPPVITYSGFGGTNLVAGNPSNEPAGTDRLRIKTYPALMEEFDRVFGNVPDELTNNASTFASVPARWYLEPKSTGVSILTTYSAAYQAAMEFVADQEKYDSAPDAASAQAECDAFARGAWQRQASDAEMAVCINMAMEGTAEDANNRSRWAHTLATMAISTGFISY